MIIISPSLYTWTFFSLIFWRVDYTHSLILHVLNVDSINRSLENIFFELNDIWIVRIHRTWLHEIHDPRTPRPSTSKTIQEAMGPSVNMAWLHFLLNRLNAAPLTLDAWRIVEGSLLHGSQHDNASLESINGHVVNPLPSESPDNVFRSDVLNNFSKPSRSKKEVHQVPLAIVTRLIAQRMLLRSNDQGEVFIQLDLQEEGKE